MTNRFSIERVRELVNKKHNIRNLSVIAHVDHGKSTLTDSLLVKAGLMNEAKVGEMRGLDTREDEKEKGITIKSTGISLAFQLDPQDLLNNAPKLISQAGQETQGWFLINLIDSPGHVDFSSEVTAALRVTDGALVVVDCVEGVCVQTETVLRQSLTERVKPVLVINKIDRALVELKLSKEELYQRLVKVIGEVNEVIGMYQDAQMGDLYLSPEKGNVAFACGKQGWAFTLSQFATRYSSKFGLDKEKMQERLWGDNFYHNKTKKWSKVEQEDSERGFNKYVMEPIYQIFKRSLELKQGYEELQDIISKLDINLNNEEQQLTEANLLKVIMRKFLPAGDALVEMAVLHLPSPAEAQRYRLENLYEGPLDDECAQAIRNCDENGPLMCYISKMVPAEQQGGSRFYAFGRVFSGKVKAGQVVRIQGPRFESGKKIDLFEKPIQRVVLMMGKTVEAVDECLPGCIVGLVGIDNYLLKSGTLTTSQLAFNFRSMKFSVSPVVKMAVEPKNPSDLMQLVEGLKRLSKADPLCLVSISESGEHIVAAAGELHLEICINDLEKVYAKIELKKGNPVVGYRETVRMRSQQVCLSKSPNRHNRILMEAEPLSSELSEAIEQGEEINPALDSKLRAQYLTENHGWDPMAAKKIWCFGPENRGPNLLVDTSKGVQYLNEIKDSMGAAFQWATQEGVLCEEPLRGCRFNIMDVVLHADAIHRGGGQIIPASRRVIHASVLTADPALMEPMYLAEIQCVSTVLGGVHQTLSKRRGQLFSEEHRIGTPLCTLKAYLPVRESFGFTADLRAATGGQAFPQLVFDHWKLMSPELMKATNVIETVRIRKGLNPQIPPLDQFLDKL